MATKANSVVNDSILSIKDGAYKQALASDRVYRVAQFVLEQFPVFPKEVPDELRAQLNEGYRLRFNETNPPKRYAVVNDHYLLIDGSNPDLEKEREIVNIGVEFAYSFTQQQFGKLKNENPYLHAVIEGWRSKVSTYCSNRLGDLKRQARVILNEGKTKDRSATLSFAEYLTKVFKGEQGLTVRCKNAKARGDDTADERKLKTAIDAFMVAWNK
jgi:hypothetical protein